jgi:hypothetical protein
MDNNNLNQSNQANLNNTMSNFAVQSGNRNVSAADENSWYSAVAMAFGKVLDGQAVETVETAEFAQAEGNPGDFLAATSAASKLSFLSTSASTTMGGITEGLSTLARKA